MDYQEMIISNVHQRGFAFAVCKDTGEQVFIPPFVALAQELEIGQTTYGRLVINPKSGTSNSTPWQCIDINFESSEPIRETEKSNNPDDSMLAILQGSQVGYYTTADLAEEMGIEHITASNAANRLFNDGKIARADVHNRAGQGRASVILWAASANCFTG